MAAQQPPGASGTNQIAANDATLQAWDSPEQPMGPNHRTTFRNTSTGQHKIVQLTTGLNYWNGTQWQPSVPAFVADPDGFTAGKTQHQIHLASDLSVSNAVTILTPDGIELDSTPVAVALYDAASGNFSVIGSITNCAGQLMSSNQVIYADAFSGDVCANVVYTITAGSFHQDVVFTGALDPTNWGFPDATTRIQILTEINGDSTPDIVTNLLDAEEGPGARRSMTSPDLVDEQLGFGSFVMTRGKAYVAPSDEVANGVDALVAKEFVTVDGINYLVESVPYESIAKGLAALPPCHPTFGRLEMKTGKEFAAIPHPRTRFAGRPSQHRPTWIGTSGLQARNLKENGVVIDYVASIGGTMTGTTIFRGDTTYLVTGAVICNGAAVFEGGSVFKYASSADSPSITLNGSLTCATSTYRPAIFTAVDDDTVGDSVNGVGRSGYTGIISSNYYANPALSMANLNVNGFRFRYAKAAIYVNIPASGTGSVSHAQFLNCKIGIISSGITSEPGMSYSNPTEYFNAYNCLFSHVLLPFSCTNYGVAGGVGLKSYLSLYNVTIDGIRQMAGAGGNTNYGSGGANPDIVRPMISGGGSPPAANLYISAYNSVFANITNFGNASLSGTNNGFFNDGGTTFGASTYTVTNSPFQTVGAGNYYLTFASGFQTNGITNSLPTTLISALAQRTTYPPCVMMQTTNATNLVLTPQAYRDVAVQSLGYHYDPLDWAIGGVYLTNSSIVVSNGAAIATFGTNGSVNGLGIGSGSSLRSIGAPNNPNWFALYNTVMEGTNNWSRLTNSVTGDLYGVSLSPSIYTRFTSWSVLVQDAVQFYAPTNTGPICFQDSEFHDGKLVSYAPTIDLTNCLLERVYANLRSTDSKSPWILNSLFRGGTLNFSANVTNATIENNLFDTTSISNNSAIYTNYFGGHNGYVTNYSRLQPTTTTDVILTNSPAYLTGTLGLYYLPTNSPLIQSGNTNANFLGLYHYTTGTNQVPETNALVDISYHYVATDAYGNPISTPGDGIPDYLADANGNGIDDSGEIPWDVAISGQPQNQAVNYGDTATFQVTATGNLPLGYQWQLNGTDISGATSASLSVADVSPASVGIYSVVVTSISGFDLTSSSASLSINSPSELGYWQFDSTNTWIGYEGQLPVAATNVMGVPSWETNAVEIDYPSGATLKYHNVETNGYENLNFRYGTISFWFKPDWSSANQGGSGPGGYGRLIETGNYSTTINSNSWVAYSTNGWWGLYLSPNGNQIFFADSTNQIGGTNLLGTVSLLSNQWSQVVLTYTPTNSALYINGLEITNGLGTIYLPYKAETTNVFRIGSDASGNNQARGAFDMLETFNYPQNSGTALTNYEMASAWDGAGGGLPNLWQWENFGYVGVNPFGDTSGDGISNLQKYQDGQNPFQFYPARLGYWQFDDPPNWLDANGLVPSTAIGLYPVISWSGDAVMIIPGASGDLAYPGTRTNGSEVTICPDGTGSVSFWFKPNWNTGTSPGEGPNDTIRLFEIGRQTTNASYGWFALTINPLGNQLAFSTQGNGVGTNNAVCPIDFATNNWVQIVLTYTPTNSALYVNGAGVATNGSGVTNYPSQSVIQQGFSLGCSWDFIHQANGCFDELQTFNYPLTSGTIASNYAAIMSVDTDDTGLSDVTKNGYGLNPTAIDSDCEGLPDAWKIENGLNPADPTVATPNNISLYVQERGSGVTNFLTIVQTNLLNVFFSNQTVNSNNPPISGALVQGAVGDTWNICSMQSDYTSNGVALFDAGSNSTSIALFAYIGPCFNIVNQPPTISDWDESKGGYIDPVTSTTIYTNLTYSATEITNATYTTNTWTIVAWVLPAPICGPGNFWEKWFAENYNIECFGPDSGTNLFQDYQIYVNQIISYDNILFPWWPRQFRGKNPPWTIFTTTTVSVQYQISTIYSQQATYQTNLNYFLASKPTLIQWTNIPPAIMESSFLNPFIGMDNYGYSLSANGGAVWSFPGTTNFNSLSETNTDNVTAGEFLKAEYPEAQRTLLVNGLSAGDYDVYVYYTCVTNVASAIINGVTAEPLANPAGSQYWYANVNTLAIPAAVSVEGAVTSSIPPWILSNPTNNCIQITLDTPDVSTFESDLRVTGLQIVSHTKITLTAPVLQAAAGVDSAYLMWQGSPAMTTFTVQRAAGATNSWTNVLSTTQTFQGTNYYQDLNLLGGTNYFYRVLGEASGGFWTTSSIVSVVPFGCAPPLPPRLDYVNPLKITANGGTYSISLGLLLTNSDAIDPQGLPLVFKVASVTSGSLMIDGVPFSSSRNTIGPTNSAVWSPPPVMGAANTPAFAVYVSDGLNNSTNLVNVYIKQSPATYLFAWGGNTAGEIGNGWMVNWPKVDGQEGWDPLGDERSIFQDPRWAYYPTNLAGKLNETLPVRVLDMGSINSIFSDGQCVRAVTSDGALYQWGRMVSFQYGLGIAQDNNTRPLTPWTWGQDPLGLILFPNEFMILTPLKYNEPGSNGVSMPFTGIKSVTGGIWYTIALKNDGTLWSWGVDDYADAPILGRIPVDDLLLDGDGDRWGMAPRQVEIPGNNSTNLNPGCEFVEVESCMSGSIARCQNGQVWWWGLVDAAHELIGWTQRYDLAGNNTVPVETPQEVFSLEIPGAAPIVQMSASDNHYVILRSDGSVSEMGYIPCLDTNNYYLSEFVDCSGFYSTNPINLAGLPNNIVQISAGFPMSAALTADGNVWIWGSVGWDGTVVAPRQITSLQNIKQVSVCAAYSSISTIIALDKQGGIWGWGYDGYWENDNFFSGYSLFGEPGGDEAFYANAVRLPGIENVSTIFVSQAEEVEDANIYALGTTVSDRPQGLLVTPDNLSVQLSWATFPGASSYIIYRSLNESSGYVAIGTTTGNTFDDQGPGLQYGQTYYYEVSAVVNGVETSPSFQVYVTLFPPPSPVQSLAGFRACQGTFIQWLPPTNALASPPQEYIVMLGGVELAELAPTVTNYNDVAANPLATNTYSVIVHNFSGWATNTVTITTNNLPLACDPAPMAATNWLSVNPVDLGSDQATLAWANPTTAGDWLFQSYEFSTNDFSGLVSYFRWTDDPIADLIWSFASTNEADPLSDTTQNITTQLPALLSMFNTFLAAC